MNYFASSHILEKMLKRCLWKAICMLAYIGLSLLGKYSQTQKHPTILLSLQAVAISQSVRPTLGPAKVISRSSVTLLQRQKNCLDRIDIFHKKYFRHLESYYSYVSAYLSFLFFNTRFLRDIEDAMIYKKLRDYLNFFRT